MSENNQKSHKYLGAIHIHSVYSDGTGKLHEIVSAAKKARLDWIIITDHNSLEIKEGFVDGVCVIKGEEISPDNNNHYLALGIENTITPDIGIENYINEVRRQGGFGFAAHPDESETRQNSNRPIRWLDKNIVPDGIEIWNWFSTWADNLNDNNIFTLAYSYFFKHSLITKPKHETLKWWDELNNKSENIIPAIGGVDAHALKITKYILPVTVFPYVEVFKTVTNMITLEDELSKDFEVAKSQILNALRFGNNIIVNRKLCSKLPQINVKIINQVATCKLTTDCDSNILELDLGRVFNVRLLCNGEVIWQQKTNKASIPLTKSGKYRLEADDGKLGYLYTNPVLVKV